MVWYIRVALYNRQNKMSKKREATKLIIIRKTKYPKLQNEMSKKNNGIKIGKAVFWTAFIFYKS